MYIYIYRIYKYCISYNIPFQTFQTFQTFLNIIMGSCISCCYRKEDSQPLLDSIIHDAFREYGICSKCHQFDEEEIGDLLYHLRQHDAHSFIVVNPYSYE